MSQHVTDRLSAFLDRELTEAEASGVRQHLGECEGCAAVLGELQGVDRAFAGLPSSPPAEYFDSFAARVRARLEGGAAAAPAAKAGLRLPVWSWALAAALLLGVLLPRLPWDEPPQPKAVAEALPPASLAATPPPGMRSSTGADEKAELRAPAQTEARRQEGASATPAPPAAPPPAKPAVKAPPAFAAAPPAAAPRLGTPPAPRAASPPALEERLESGAAADLGRPLPDRDDARLAAAEEEVLAPPVTAAAETLAKKKDSSSEAPSAAAPGRAAAGALARERRNEPARRVVPEGEADALKSLDESGGEAARVEFESLAARPSQTAAELRALRAAWRAFLTRHPEDPRGDEARVRVVVASTELWARTGAADDRAEARREAEAYLRRPDAAQKERVSALLVRLDP
ncbi:MAG TPA: anti-sigma factor [Vicinamibacteria bacterium]